VTRTHRSRLHTVKACRGGRTLARDLCPRRGTSSSVVPPCRMVMSHWPGMARRPRPQDSPSPAPFTDTSQGLESWGVTSGASHLKDGPRRETARSRVEAQRAARSACRCNHSATQVPGPRLASLGLVGKPTPNFRCKLKQLLWFLVADPRSLGLDGQAIPPA
jgi:hypothetical protein